MELSNHPECSLRRSFDHAASSTKQERPEWPAAAQQQHPQPVRKEPEALPPPTSDRQLQQARMVAVPDPRTNSIIVNSSHETMEQIALTIGRLDATDSKKQHVYVELLEHADPDNVATILRGMFGNQTSGNRVTSQPTSSQAEPAHHHRSLFGCHGDFEYQRNSGGSGRRSLDETDDGNLTQPLNL